MLRNIPLLFLVPEDGRTLLQPLWVEDLATCLLWALDNETTRNQTISIGGPEYLPFNDVRTSVMEATGLRRTLLHIAPPYLRAMTVTLDFMFTRTADLGFLVGLPGSQPHLCAGYPAAQL